jgi:hypothetical protein
MTSHKGVFEEHSADELDRLIQWALRERVVKVSPSPHIWERIKEHAECCAVLRQTRWGFSSFLRAVTIWLSADAAQTVFVAQPVQRDRIMTWEYDLGWVRVLGQRRMMMWPVS